MYFIILVYYTTVYFIILVCYTTVYFIILTVQLVSTTTAQGHVYNLLLNNLHWPQSRAWLCVQKTTLFKKWCLPPPKKKKNRKKKTTATHSILDFILTRKHSLDAVCCVANKVHIQTKPSRSQCGTAILSALSDKGIHSDQLHLAPSHPALPQWHFVTLDLLRSTIWTTGLSEDNNYVRPFVALV